MRAKKISESISFERGSTKNLFGLAQSIALRIDELREKGILLSMEPTFMHRFSKNPTKKWYLMVKSDMGFHSTKKILMEYFGDYIETILQNVVSKQETTVVLKPEFTKYFIEAYNLKYPDFKVSESISFERGNPNRLFGITQIISQKWEEIVKTGIGSITLEKWKPESKKWHLTITLAAFKGLEGAERILEEFFGEYIDMDTVFYTSGKELVVNIKPEFVKFFIEAYNLRYSEPIEESHNFERKGHPYNSLGVGIELKVKRDFSSDDERLEFLVSILPRILNTDGIPNDLVSIKQGFGFINNKYYDPIVNYVWCYTTIKGNTTFSSDYFAKLFIQKYPYLLEESSSNFERGKDPKKTLRLGKYTSLMRIAFDDPENAVTDEASFKKWLNNNILLKTKILHNRPKDRKIYTFDLRSYCQENNIDEKDIKSEFISTGNLSHLFDDKPGSVSVMDGKLKDGSRVLYYSGGFNSGYITREDWLK